MTSLKPPIADSYVEVVSALVFSFVWFHKAPRCTDPLDEDLCVWQCEPASADRFPRHHGMQTRNPASLGATTCDREPRLTLSRHPMRRSAARTRLALAAGQWLMRQERRTGSLGGELRPAQFAPLGP